MYESNRPANRIIFTGSKETFLTRVLMKKAEDSGATSVFVPWTVNALNENLNEAILVILFMEEGEKPASEVFHFLMDSLDERNMQLMAVGGQNEIPFVLDRAPGDLIYKVFYRPVDNMLFSQTISEFIAKARAGEFKKSILVVDDDPQYLALVREWLKEKYKITMANSGLQAIKWLGKNKVDLILLDHEMPVTSGPQVLEMLRSDPETSSIPVMFLTGKRDKASVMAVVALKPEGYFLKGIQKEELLEKLEEYFVLHKEHS